MRASQRVAATPASAHDKGSPARDHAPANPPARLRLQRQYGNRRAHQIIQAKLNVGPADDRFEREADRIATQALGTSPAAHTERVRRAPGAAGGVADPAVGAAVRRARGGGRPVPRGVRERMEQVRGVDLGGVRVHVDAESDQLNDALGSRAFTVGADVFVRRSEYRPGSARGDALLGHELVHTVQQGATTPAAESSASSPIGSGPDVPTTQRLFGFEFEIGVPVSFHGTQQHHRIVDTGRESSGQRNRP